MRLLAHQSSSTKTLHSNLAHLIEEKGMRYEKRHGSWYILHIASSLWFQMDSWNRQIFLKMGEANYNYSTGFGGKTLTYVGIDFGGFETNLSDEQYVELEKLILENT